MCGVGIEIQGGRVVELIPRGSPVPIRRSLVVTTVADGKRAIEVRVVRCAPGPVPATLVGRFLLSRLHTEIHALRPAQPAEYAREVGSILDTAALETLAGELARTRRRQVSARGASERHGVR
jgi:molecular chaperone DnaK (HSP70)